MKTQRHFEIESETARREAAQIRTMIADLDRRVGLLNSDIASEEERVRVSDPSNFAYPIHAKTMAARRDNLRVTIAALDQRLEKIDAAQREAAAAAYA
jgi:hypothetical protein